MKKNKRIILLIFIVIFLTCTFLIFEHRKLPEKMIALGCDMVFTPDGYADKYLYDPIGNHVWMFSLNQKEQKLAEQYINDYPDVWGNMSEEILGIIKVLIIENEKVGIDEISIENSYCSIFSLGDKGLIKDYEAIAEEGLLLPRAIYIYDKLNKNYFCMFIANR